MPSCIFQTNGRLEHITAYPFIHAGRVGRIPVNDVINMKIDLQADAALTCESR
jgi:hypothetical protein